MPRGPLAVSLLLLLFLAALPPPLTAQTPAPAGNTPREVAGKFEDAIRQFESEDRRQFPPADAILCTGSSSMRFWHPRLAQDLAPLAVIPRGFGGSTFADLLRYTPRIVLPYRPRAIVLYEGDNDIAQGASPEQVLRNFQTFVHTVHTALPQTRIYFLSIKPSPKRLALWPAMQRANLLIQGECARNPRLAYVDVATPMLDARGQPRPELFQDDGLHMNPDGYRIWRDILKPLLLQRESAGQSPEKTGLPSPRPRAILAP